MVEADAESQPQVELQESFGLTVSFLHAFLEKLQLLTKQRCFLTVVPHILTTTLRRRDAHSMAEKE